MIRLPNETADFIDCRETAPKAPHMSYRKVILSTPSYHYIYASHGRKVIASPEPTSGSALIFMLNLLELIFKGNYLSIILLCHYQPF
ncbi:hypothetical protein F8M41_001546 [Gigaspora margarita]|uniref:Uncharacterized protein n=1 Tax=Gigaspora margarita TaxID=4874 RepID=A0A8H4AYY5_GIGMA|nr:hypothetical protein F8M41_001546 [Gigaspora margarita]